MFGGTHISVKYFGTHLMAYASDAEIHVFLVTIAVVESENKGSWSWFLFQMHDAIMKMEHDLVIIFDR